jgi:hypothetical protein
MASPFPGVDPFIEDQHYWPDFHQSFMTYWRDSLLDVLPANYDARLEERVHRVELSEENSGDPKYPDITVSQLRPSPRRRRAAAGGTLTLQPITVALPLIEEARESYLRILHRPDRTLVAVLELLSPSNKSGSGFSTYLAKRREVLSEDVHLVEVDLLLDGHRLPMRRPLPPGDFYVIVSRSERRPQADVFAWALRDPLPTIPIPLRAPDPDILVDLGGIFNVAYDRGRYARALRYDQPLSLPLNSDDRRWAQKQAKSRRR